MIDSPRRVTDVIDAFNDDAKFLEVNAKTGLYPLYAAYSICRNLFHDITEDDLRDFRDEVVRDNIRLRWGVNTLYLEKLIGDLNSEHHRVWAKILNLHIWNKEGDVMKFDIAVGNPPYQEISNDSDNKNFAKPVYHQFIELAMKVADKASLIHPARCLFNAGATPKDWTERFLNNEHVTVAKYSANSSYFFNNVDIKGGIAITYFNKQETIGSIGLFFPADELRTIHDKVVSRADFKPFSEIVYPRATYRLVDGNSSIGTNAFDKQRELFLGEKPDDGHEYIKILGRVGTARVYKYIRRDYVCETDNLTKYKVFVPSSNGSGLMGMIGKLVIGSPLVACTETFTAIGSFDTESEAVAAFKYVKTKFARALLGILKVTQHNPASTWVKVPQQDFSANSDIDWSGSVEEIDRQLYEKYLLNDVEIEFIQRNITAMD